MTPTHRDVIEALCSSLAPGIMCEANLVGNSLKNNPIAGRAMLLQTNVQAKC